MPTYAISDIHGSQEKFNTLIDLISFNKKDKLFILGDFVDRGLESKEVLDTIMSLKESNYDITVLRGNHEQMMIDASVGVNVEFWLNNGGRETLLNFGIENIQQIPTSYITFLNSTKHYAIYNRFILVHAGINMMHQEPLNDNHSMLWQRDPWKNYNGEWLGNRTIIHGHTPMNKKAILYQKHNIKIICIDNGVHIQNKYGFGSICALNLDTMDFIFSNE